MNADYIALQPWQVALATALILICGVISLILRLGMERRLFVAAVRTVLQLWLVGLVLDWIFKPNQPWSVVLAMALVMTFIAGLSAVRRNERRYAGIWFDSVVSMWASSWLVASIALFGVIQVQHGEHAWYNPQYAIPLLGMVLGNTLNGIALGMDRFASDMLARRDQIETLLALGATRWEAARGVIQVCVRTGMIPTINTMMVVGLVSLPGMMTGQIIAGMKPDQAVLYQIVIMFLLAAGTALGTVAVVLLGYARLFNAKHQFLAEKITKQ